MTDSLEQIKRLRKKYNLTQKDLAVEAGVSQSLIAKIESGKLDPTYTKAQLIFQALERLQNKEEKKAKDIMNKKIYFADVNDSLTKTIKVMKTKGISQLPVMSKGNVCGLITESIILKKIVSNPEKINELKAGDIMEDAPPIISSKTRIKTILNLLQENSLLIVSKKGMPVGVISKADLL